MDTDHDDHTPKKESKIYNGAHRSPLDLYDVTYYFLVALMVFAVASTATIFVFFFGAALGWW